MLLVFAIGGAAINLIAIRSIVRSSAVLQAEGINGEILLTVTAKLWRAVARLVAAVVITAAILRWLPHEAVEGAIVALIWVVSVLDWLAKVAGERMALERIRRRGR